MYLDYFGFEEEPFNITPNSRFLFLSERHREALASLLYGIEHRKGFIALTGAIGCGKTTICRAMLGRLDRDKVRLALILNPELNDLELLQTINAEFGIDATSTSKRELLAALNKFLLAEYEEDRNVVLLIDEAQRLSPLALEQVRLLSNLETESAKLIQIALVGQPELADILDLPELEQLNQRITVRYHISPLDLDQIEEYIAHRIDVAGAKRPVRFTKKAVKSVFEYSGGVPRRVNVVCDRALLVAFVRETDEINEDIISKAIEESGGIPKRNKPAKDTTAVTANDYTEALKARARTSKPEVATASAYTQAPQRRSVLPTVFFVTASAVLAVIIYANKDAIYSSFTEVVPASETTVAEVPLGEPQTPVVAEKIPDPSPGPTPGTPRLFPAETVAAVEPEATAEPVAEEVAEVSIQAAPEVPAEEPAATAAVVEEEVIPEEPASPWAYDRHGILRVENREQSFPAAILTWLDSKRGDRLVEEDLNALRSLTVEQLRTVQLTHGKAPFFLREAHLAPSLQTLRGADLPAIILTDEDSPNFGPWCVLVAMNESKATLHDPLRGRIDMDRDVVEDHLASIIVPFFDPNEVVGLSPQDSGAAVAFLQNRLQQAGYFIGEPTGTFDEATADAVRSFRETLRIPGGAEIDPVLAMRLLHDSEARQ